jgi:trehalose/maltose transport system permease protein
MSQSAITTTKVAPVASKLESTRNVYAWVFLAPTILVITLIALFPLAQTFYLSFTNARFGQEETQFNGLTNYVNLITNDSVFADGVKVAIFFTLITVTFETVLGLIIALVVNSNFKGRGVMRAVMLIPWAIPTVVSTKLWAWMYNDQSGVFSDMLQRLGIVKGNFAFLATNNGTPFALGVISAIDIWKTTPFMALLLLAGLQLIPLDMYEAARVDGASWLQQFFSLTLPLLRPALVVALVLRTLDALRAFDVFYVLYGNRADIETMSVYAQQRLVGGGRVGYGSALCVAIFAIILVFVFIYVTFFKVEEA